MKDLEHLRIAVIATDGVEEPELLDPLRALTEAGGRAELLGLDSKDILTFRHLEPGQRIPVQRTLQDAHAEDYGALLLPGGALNADRLRAEPSVLDFVRAIHRAGKPIAAICHAPWILISAGLARGRTLTSYASIQDDLKNAGAHWVDSEVVCDENWVTSRHPGDLPAFNRETMSLFSRATPPIIQIAESA